MMAKEYGGNKKKGVVDGNERCLVMIFHLFERFNRRGNDREEEISFLCADCANKKGFPFSQTHN